MRYRIHPRPEIEELHVDSEEQLITALLAGGWELQQRAARAVEEGRERRFTLARESKTNLTRVRLPSVTDR